MDNWNGVCQRCCERAVAFTMSRFSTELICFRCSRKEPAHPEYEKAREAEIAAFSRGDVNFPVIGKPEDL